MERIIVFQPEEDSELVRLADQMKIRLVYAGPEDMTKKLEDIACGNGKESGRLSELPGSMLVFCDVSEKHLNRLLFGLRQKQVKAGLKAILTPTNRAWTPLQLYRELEREHAQLSGCKQP